MEVKALGEFTTFEEMLSSAKDLEAQLHNEFWGFKGEYSDLQVKLLDNALRSSNLLRLYLDMLIRPEFHFKKG